MHAKGWPRVSWDDRETRDEEEAKGIPGNSLVGNPPRFEPG